MNLIQFSSFLIVLSSISIINANDLPELNELSEDLQNSLETVLGRLGLNNTLSQLLSGFPDINKNLNQVTECFASELPGNVTLNIFDGNLNFASIVKVYYDSFSENRISIGSIVNLLNSTKQIVQHCLESNDDTNNNDTKSNNKVKYGYTSLSDKSDRYVQRMLGVISTSTDTNSTIEQRRRHKRLTGSDPRCQPSISESELPESFDWRDRNVVTPPKQQGKCGSCWTFATVGAIESAYLIHNRTNDPEFDLSEQQLVDCATIMFRGCRGGNSLMSFSYVRQRGITSEEEMPYRARSTFCHTYFKPMIAEIDNYCIRSRHRYSSSFETEHLSEEDIQRTLVSFGPLYIALDASHLSKNYRGGIFNDRSCKERVNHAVLLVGYTPDSWIIKNSWGIKWGEDGYFRLARGFNRCGINTEIAYPLLYDNNN